MTNETLQGYVLMSLGSELIYLKIVSDELKKKIDQLNNKIKNLFKAIDEIKTIEPNVETTIFESKNKSPQLIQYYIDLSQLDPEDTVIVREYIGSQDNPIVIEEEYTDTKYIMSNIHIVSYVKITIQIDSIQPKPVRYYIYMSNF